MAADAKLFALDLALSAAFAASLAAAVSFGWSLHYWVAGFALNLVVGCVVCALIDDREQSLLRWVRCAPSFWLEVAAITVWPLLMWVRLRAPARD